MQKKAARLQLFKAITGKTVVTLPVTKAPRTIGWGSRVKEYYR